MFNRNISGVNGGQPKKAALGAFQPKNNGVNDVLLEKQRR